MAVKSNSPDHFSPVLKPKGPVETVVTCTKHENVIGLLDIFIPARYLEEFNNVYLATHLMEPDLKKKIMKCQFMDDHVQFFI